jgi:hypothetical protein
MTTEDNFKQPDLKQYTDENVMQDLPSTTIEITPIVAIAIISHIQLAIRHPTIEEDILTRIAIDTARQLQNLFNPESATYRVLELGWNSEADLLVPLEELCDEPCEKFLANLGCRCTGYKVAEVIADDNDEISPEILVAGAAMMQQFAQNLRSEGFEVVTDM